MLIIHINVWLPHVCKYFRSVVQCELRRMLFNQFERLEEGFRYRDPDKTGRVSKDTAYTVLRGANLPLDKDLVCFLLDRWVHQRGCCTQLYEEHTFILRPRLFCSYYWILAVRYRICNNVVYTWHLLHTDLATKSMYFVQWSLFNKIIWRGRNL